MTLITTIEVEKGYIDVSPETKSYLHIKCDFVLRMYAAKRKRPEDRTPDDPKEILTSKGQPRKTERKQDIVDHLINAEEKAYNYLWPYKPEVTFSLPHTDEEFAVPNLKNGTDINRRHTRWKASKSKIENGYTVRPDIIVVENKETRWPGREVDETYYGHAYEDNLKYLLEMKFPGDSLDERQKRNYIRIATRERFSVLKINSHEKDEKNQTQEQFSVNRVPAFSPEFKSKALKLETWVTNPDIQPIDLIGENIDESLNDHFRPATVQSFANDVPWLKQQGKFHQQGNTISWESSDPREPQNVLKYNSQELQQAVDYLSEDTDIAPDEIPYIENVSISMSDEETVDLILEVTTEVGITLISLFFVPLAIARTAIFALRLAKYAPALGAAVGLWATGTQVASANDDSQDLLPRDFTGCVYITHLVEKPDNPNGNYYKIDEYAISDAPWQSCIGANNKNRYEGLDD